MTQVQTDSPKMLSNRSFGLIFAAIFSVIALFPLLFGNDLRLWAMVVAALFAIPALFFASILTPLNKAWMKFGQIMHTILNPVLLGLVFFIPVLLTGIALRLLRKDPMNRKFDPNATSYWITREQGLIEKDNFNNQF